MAASVRVFLNTPRIIYFQAKIGDHLGIASHVNITRSLFGIFTLLDDGGNGNIVVNILKNKCYFMIDYNFSYFKKIIIMLIFV